MTAFFYSSSAASAYRSPLSIAFSRDGQTLYVSDRTAACLTALNAATGGILHETLLEGEPNGLALSPDGKILYVAERKSHAVAVVDSGTGNILRRIPTGTWPVALAVSHIGSRLYSCNRGNHTVSVIDAKLGAIDEIPAGRDPACAVLSPDDSLLAVANFLPQGAGTDPDVGAEVTILKPSHPAARIKLPPGSTMAGGLWIAPSGRWAYATHVLGRFDLPITKLEEGWVHTAALTILDLDRCVAVATLLLDSLTQGAADPCAVIGSADGKTLWISHRGTHQISRLDIGLIHELLEGSIPDAIAARKEGGRDNIWVRIRNDRTQLKELRRDLTALHVAGAIRRFYSGGTGPTGLALSPDGKRLAVANYYSGSVAALDAAKGEVLATFPLSNQPAPDAARRGEIYFHDATRCFQHWHSCATCHLDGGRVDGLPWDFLRDGIDNGKDVISLVNLPHTPPYNRLATRPDARYCIESGISVSHQVTATSTEVEDVLAYVASLAPEPNPNLPKFLEAARRGHALFAGKAHCSGCHAGPYFTDQRVHDVGTSSPSEPNARYDTPSLIEAYRTAPYYHDGRAPTIRDALTNHGRNDRHGRLSVLSPAELEDLIAFVESL